MPVKLPPHIRLIIIAGLTASGKSTLVELLSKKIGWDTMSAGDISRKYCEEKGLDLPTTKDLELHERLEELIKEKVTNGKNLILASRTGAYHSNQLDKGRSEVYCILITAPEQVRIRRLAARNKISIDEAAKKLQKRDRLDLELYEELYGVNPLDPRYYDLVLDAEVYGPDELVRMVIEDCADNS